MSPVYTGNDAILSVLFPKIGQKRDSKTKWKALFDLKDFLENSDNNKNKKTKAEALSHFLYLYKTKLAYDNSSKVRAVCIQICTVVSKVIPKAWNNLVVNVSNVSSVGASENENVEILGMIVCSIADPSLDVRTASIAFITEASSKEEEEEEEILQQQQASAYNNGIWRYSKRILSYNTSVDMYQDLFQKKSIGGNSKSGNSNGEMVVVLIVRNQ